MMSQSKRGVLGVCVLSAAFVFAAGAIFSQRPASGAGGQAAMLRSPIKRVHRGTVTFLDQIHEIKSFNRNDESRVLAGAELPGDVDPSKCVVLLDDPVVVHHGLRAGENDLFASAMVESFAPGLLIVRIDRTGRSRPAPGRAIDASERAEPHWVVGYQIIEYY